MRDGTSSWNIKSLAKDLPGQVVLVLQGGGALGSYQAGVYQALHDGGIEPDWIIGTSIGAINASLSRATESRIAFRSSKNSGSGWSKTRSGIFTRPFPASMRD